MKEVYLVGEDEVTKAIVRKIMAVYTPELVVKRELPARGSEIKQKIVNFNNLSATTPVVLLTDLDTEDCAPIAKKKLLAEVDKQEDNFIINIAVDEAEAWLMADRKNFAEFLGINLQDMPVSTLQKQGGRKSCTEMSIPLKASYYLTHKLIFLSNKEELKEQIKSQGDRCKGKEYNTALVPFIENQWSPENAKENSDSLQRMIIRLQDLSQRLF